MAEQSFPVVEQPVTVDQWKSVTRGIGDGVLDDGGNPYNLTGLDNALNTARVAVDTLSGEAAAILKGFYHQLTADAQISLPAVSQTTTYYVVLQYDPARKELPVKLVVVTTLDRSLGKAYLVLWTVRRDPNQLLTAATITKTRPTVIPTVQVDRADQLPEPASVLWGTRGTAYQTGVTYRASWTQWVPVSPHRVAMPSMAGWELRSATGGILCIPTEGGVQCHTAGLLVRRGGSYSIGQDWYSMGTLLPEGYRPPYPLEPISRYRETEIALQLTPAGVLSSRVPVGSLGIDTTFSIPFDFTWFVAKAVTA